MRAGQAGGHLLTDLKRTSLLNETLVVLGGNSAGRPCDEAAAAAAHNTTASAIWMAGGGIEGGAIVGAPTTSSWRRSNPGAHQRHSRRDPAPDQALDRTKAADVRNGRDELTNVAAVSSRSSSA